MMIGTDVNSEVSWTGSLIASCSDLRTLSRAEEDLKIGNGRLSRRRTYVGAKSGVDQCRDGGVVPGGRPKPEYRLSGKYLWEVYWEARDYLRDNESN